MRAGTREDLQVDEQHHDLDDDCSTVQVRARHKVIVGRIVAGDLVECQVHYSNDAYALPYSIEQPSTEHILVEATPLQAETVPRRI